MLQAATLLGERLMQHRLMIGLAESCTGGLLASTLTDVSGSSRYVAGGIVSYSNALKMALLGVPEETLITHGAVSEATAHAMAVGALNTLDVGIAVSLTGIAGPGGGTADKPVGLVYIGVALREAGTPRVVVRRYQWTGTRQHNKEQSVLAAIQLALELLPEHPTLL